ncbi:MAG: transcriptional regulator [Actinomycetota bacterium]|nr:transcriptional regulator [Actinomycetota bacterium]
MSRADFGVVREALGVTAGNLSKHLRVLEEAGYVQLDKVFEKRRPVPGSSSPPPVAARSTRRSPTGRRSPLTT